MAKILIVEDDEEIAQIERDYLEMGGYEVDVKNDGSGVAELLVGGSFDLLVLDLMLPGASGYDICKAVFDIHFSLDNDIICDIMKERL